MASKTEVDFRHDDLKGWQRRDLEGPTEKGSMRFALNPTEKESEKGSMRVPWIFGALGIWLRLTFRTRRGCWKWPRGANSRTFSGISRKQL